MTRYWPGFAAMMLIGACHSQPRIVTANSTTEAQLAEINAQTNVTDGMDQGNDLLMATPSAGQQMNVRPDPAKAR
jgi:hypothetical protein